MFWHIQYRCIYILIYEFCSILTSPQGESKYKERVKIYSDIFEKLKVLTAKKKTKQEKRTCICFNISFKQFKIDRVGFIR